MKATRRGVIAGTAALSALPASARKADAIAVTTPMATPRWAELQRRLLSANAEACETYYRRYVGPNDELQCFERWGANDGPDDAAEFTNDWITLHALGAPDRLLSLSQRFWDAHLKQYARGRTVETPIARNGMYHREFPVQMDWQVVALAAGCSVATGLFFGFYPARKAAQLDPIEALRHQG